MIAKEQVIKSFEAVLVPSAQRSIVGLNLVREVTVSDGKVNIALASTGLIPGVQDWIKTKAREAIEKLPEVKEVTVEYSDATILGYRLYSEVKSVMLLAKAASKIAYDTGALVQEGH